MQRRRKGPGHEPRKCAVAIGALPKHPEQKGRKERRVDEGKNELQHVHDVVKFNDHIGREQ